MPEDDPSLRTGSVQLDPSDALHEPWVHLPVEEFIEFLSDEIQATGVAWQELDACKRDGLGMRVQEAVDADEAADEKYYNLETAQNREERRGYLAANHRQTRDRFRNIINYAQFTSSLAEFGDKADQELAQQIIIAEGIKANIDKLDAAHAKPSDAVASQLFNDVEAGFKTAITTEHAMLDKVSVWLGAHINHAIDLVDWLSSEEAAEPEYRPFLQSLASQHFDANTPSILGDYLDKIRTQPTLYQKTFMNELVARALDEDTVTSDADLSWLHFILGQDVDDAHKAGIIDKLLSDPIDQLPLSLAMKLRQEHGSFVNSLKQRYEQLLSPHNRPEHHITFEPTFPERDSRPVKAGSSRRRRSGRTTPKSSVGQAANGAETRKEAETITQVLRGAKTDESWIGIPLQAEEQTAIDALMESKIVSKYLKTYVSETTLPDDLRRMLESILKQPRGNGATKMRGRRIPMRVDGNHRRLSVWHLNPSERGMTTAGSVAPYTRIFYATWPLETDEEALILLDVDHKNNAAKQNGNFRTTS